MNRLASLSAMDLKVVPPGESDLPGLKYCRIPFLTEGYRMKGEGPPNKPPVSGPLAN